jgi:hypothetical protein
VAVAQRLDARIATTLRRFSVAHQREESLSLLQRQAERCRRWSIASAGDDGDAGAAARVVGARLLASQERFQGQAEAAYAGLAQSVDRTLQASLTEGARIAGETIRPVAEATLAGIARETAALHAALAGTMQGQLDQLSARFEASTTTSPASWQRCSRATRARARRWPRTWPRRTNASRRPSTSARRAAGRRGAAPRRLAGRDGHRRWPAWRARPPRCSRRWPMPRPRRSMASARAWMPPCSA